MSDQPKTPPSDTSNWPDPDRERAQPGDVLGIERGGETTSLGESAEDEDERRKDAEREVDGRK
jgi:hypothetical protein